MWFALALALCLVMSCSAGVAPAKVPRGPVKVPRVFTTLPAQAATPVNAPLGQCVCGLANQKTGRDAADRIVNGHPAQANEFPWQVSLVQWGSREEKEEEDRTPFCGGTIIDKKWVLTAAHCTVDFPSSAYFQVVVGDVDHTDASSGKKIHLASKTEHPSYNLNDDTDSDFSLLELAEELDFSDYTVRPACLPSDASNTYVGASAIVSGWGTLYTDGPQPNTLMEVEQNVLANDNCGSWGWGQITENMLCATAEGKDSCQGDSGGPLVSKDSSTGRFSLIGVVSFGADCANPNLPGVYSRVTQALDWIKQTTNYANMCNVA